MTRWVALHDAVANARDERTQDWCNAMIVQVRRAATAKMCGDYEIYRIKRTGRTIELKPRNTSVMKTVKAEVTAIALCGLPSLENAKLAFRIVLKADQRRIEQYTISVVGEEKRSGRPWFVRVDLDEEQKGEGPCSHGLLHGHVGVDPAEKGGQESRMPLPWLDPDEALAWILATLDGRLEPS